MDEPGSQVASDSISLRPGDRLSFEFLVHLDIRHGDDMGVVQSLMLQRVSERLKNFLEGVTFEEPEPEESRYI